jgi:3-oxoacyl-[acyl-carrier protein] reductase
VNVSSIFGLVSRSKRDSYSASKAGLIGLTRAAALDLAPYGILVNALCPGFTLTDLTRSILSKDEMKRLSSEIPLGRFAREEEIAASAVFLCSDLNTYITGQAIAVDGGFTAI